MSAVLESLSKVFEFFFVNTVQTLCLYDRCIGFNMVHSALS